MKSFNKNCKNKTFQVIFAFMGLNLLIGFLLGCVITLPGSVVADEATESIDENIDQFWTKVQSIYENDSGEGGYLIEINTKASADEVLIDLKTTIDDLGKMINNMNDAAENSEDATWEYRNIGLPNYQARLNVLVLQLELKYVEEHLRSDQEDVDLKSHYEELQTEFFALVRDSSLSD